MAFVDVYVKSDADRLAHQAWRDKPSLFGQTWIPASLAFVGGMLTPMSNLVNNKPIYTASWRAVLGGAIGLAVGIYLRDRNQQRNLEKWAIVRDYIDRHPEDFPPYPPRVKIGDTLERWIPFRTGW